MLERSLSWRCSSRGHDQLLLPTANSNSNWPWPRQMCSGKWVERLRSFCYREINKKLEEQRQRQQQRQQQNCVSNHVRLDRRQTVWTNCGNVYEIVISRHRTGYYREAFPRLRPEQGPRHRHRYRHSAQNNTKSNNSSGGNCNCNSNCSKKLPAKRNVTKCKP